MAGYDVSRTSGSSTRRSSGVSQDKYAVLLSDVSEHGNVTSPMTTEHSVNGSSPFTPGQAHDQKPSSSIDPGTGNRYDDNDEVSITLNDASL